MSVLSLADEVGVEVETLNFGDEQAGNAKVGSLEVVVRVLLDYKHFCGQGR